MLPSTLNKTVKIILGGLIVPCMSLFSDYAQARTPNDWENPHVLGINTLPYHVTLDMPSGERERKDIVWLDGEWTFKWSPDPDSRPVGFQDEYYDLAGWDKITVPGNWQMQNF